MTPIYFLLLHKVWSILHHGQWDEFIKKYYLIFFGNISIFLAFFCVCVFFCFYHKIRVLIIFIYLVIYLLIYLFIHSFFYLFIYLFIYIYSFIYLLIYLLFTYLFIYLIIHLFIYLFIYLLLFNNLSIFWKSIKFLQQNINQ